MGDLFGGEEIEAPAPKKKTGPDAIELTVLHQFVNWGPFTYTQFSQHMYFVEKYKRISDQQLQAAFESCVRSNWLKPLGVSLAEASRGTVVWGLVNTRKYKVYVSREMGQMETCRAWEARTGFRCVCCRLGPLPSSGRDPGMHWVKEALW